MSPPELPWQGARAIARAVHAHEVSPLEIVQAHLGRMEGLEPQLGAFIAQNVRAVDDAGRAAKGPLAGVPITVKDIIVTRGMRTTAGSRTFGEGLPGAADAPLIKRLRRAGAVVLGKTNLHELAMGVTTVNEHFGPAHNPWQRERVAGGSSGGSAVAVAAGMGTASIGTDTRGSIRIPAACCGITGLKPTFGLVDVSGVVPLAPTLDHVGPMTRSVVDAALLLGIMAGWPRRAARWMEVVDAPPQPRARIGICEWFFQDLDEAIEGPIRAAADLFSHAGFPIEQVEISGLNDAHLASGVITSAEALAFHAERLATNPDGIGPLVRARLEKGRSLTAVDYVRASEQRVRIVAAFEEVFKQVDLLLAPTLPAFPPPIGEQDVRINGHWRGVLDSFTRLNAVANMAGIPALSIPCGSSADGLPVGLQLIAAANRESTLLSAGAWYQQETDWHTMWPGTS